ncbi:MAG: hypothetical protein QOF76_1435 [Solirubrobacteraceae bacterium]|nr:hypothetical protein [Solirubrobacteraceae bacterium]
MLALRRRRPAPRAISEDAAYSRLHGDRGGDVTLVKREPRRPRYQLRVSGDQLRRCFEEKLEARKSA